MFPNVYSFRGGRGVGGDGFMGRARRRSSLLSNLLAHWKLEEESGTRYDSVQGRAMWPYGAVTRGAGKVGLYAAQFVPATSDYLRCAGTGDLRMTGKSFTIGGWVYFDALGDQEPLAAKWDLGSQEYLVATDGTYLYFAVSGDGESCGMVTHGEELQTGQWYHFAAWHDQVGGSLNLSLNNGAPASTSYTNGVFFGERT